MQVSLVTEIISLQPYGPKMKESLSYPDSEDISATIHEGVAVVTLLVRARGMREGKPFAGVFRNIRIFVHEPDKQQPWQLHAWFNVRVPDAQP